MAFPFLRPSGEFVERRAQPAPAFDKGVDLPFAGFELRFQVGESFDHHLPASAHPDCGRFEPFPISPLHFRTLIERFLFRLQSGSLAIHPFLLARGGLGDCAVPSRAVPSAGFPVLSRSRRVWRFRTSRLFRRRRRRPTPPPVVPARFEARTFGDRFPQDRSLAVAVPPMPVRGRRAGSHGGRVLPSLWKAKPPRPSKPLGGASNVRFSNS